MSNRNNPNTPERQAYMKEYNKAWWIAHPTYKKSYAFKNKDKLKAQRKVLSQTVKYKRTHCIGNMKWDRNNRGKANARIRAYELKKLNATPKWVDLNKIEMFYILAKKMEDMFNKKFHVDHIWPIQGKTFSGLHVPWNLQILPASLNCSKQNLPPTQWKRPN